MAEERIVIPTAPHFEGLPENIRARWRETYAKAFKQALIDSPNDVIAQRQAAEREANRIFRVDELLSYKDAMALENWKVLHRREVNGELKIVTIDGRKFSFPVPRNSSKDKE